MVLCNRTKYVCNIILSYLITGDNFNGVLGRATSSALSDLRGRKEGRVEEMREERGYGEERKQQERKW